MSICEGLGASLPLPRNGQENTDLNTAFQTLGAYFIALGATDVETEGSWIDSNGDLLTYFNWDTDGSIKEPNNHNEREHYMLYMPMKNGKWSDRSRGAVVDVVCQKPQLTG